MMIWKERQTEFYTMMKVGNQIKGTAMKNSNFPKIGVTLDYNTDETYAKTPWYALRANYIEAFASEGARIELLHYEYSDVEALVSELDGLVITGGNFDVAPELYGKSIEHQSVNPNFKRTRFEMALCKAAIAAKLPILGICGGEQLINVAMGGSLIQHIPQEVPNCLEHEQKAPKHLPTHNIKIMTGTKLHAIIGSTNADVNSTHHQAVKDLGNGIIVNAIAPDGVIEGIESDDPNWLCIGVQWHPEYMYTDNDIALIKHFVKTCRNQKN
jgi:putative glutamine amidotransferase